MERPIGKYIFLFILGILAGYYKLAIPYIVFIILASFLISRDLFLAGIFLLGYLNFSFFINSSHILDLDPANKVRLTVYVKDELNKEEDFARYSVDLLSLEGKKVKREKLYLDLYGKSQIEVGDYISLLGRPSPLAKNTNKFLYNPRLTALSKGYLGKITVKDYELEVLFNKKSQGMKLKDRFYIRFEKAFKGLNERNRDFVRDVILGSKSLDQEESINYRKLGLGHLLAISGLHISIIYLILNKLFLGLRFKAVFRNFFSFSLLFIYVGIIGYPPSAVRALFMIGFSLLADILKEPKDHINNLYVSLFIILILRPYWLFSLGLQLSFLASYSILAIYPFVNRWINPWNLNILSMVGINLSVYLGTFPFQAYYFNGINLISIISNLLLIPIFTINLFLSFIQLIVSWDMLARLIDMLLNLQFLLTGILSSFKGFNISLGSPGPYGFILYYLVLYFILVVDKLSLRRDLYRLVVFYIGLLLIVFTYQSYQKNLWIEFIDVGQGDSILIRSKGANYLMDTGGSLDENNRIGKYITASYLKKTGVKRLDGIFISHFHSDHFAGLRDVIDEIDTRVIFIADRDYEDYLKGVNKKIVGLRRGDVLKLKDGIEIKIFNPGKKLYKDNENNNSLVVLMAYGGRSLLLTGDMEEEVEGELLAYEELKGIDIIKVPHHGSKSSSSLSFLKHTRPKISVIQAGRSNLYGHPHREVVDNYGSIGSRLLSTKDEGLIRVNLKTLEIETMQAYIEEDFGHVALGLVDYINFFGILTLWAFIINKEEYFLEGNEIGIY